MIKITLRNYRGFSSDHPAEYVLDSGFVSFVGKNNSGKSTCLRAIYELRTLFGNSRDVWLGRNGNQVAFDVPGESDPTVVLNFNNENPAFVTVEVDAQEADGPDRLRAATVRLERSGVARLEELVLERQAGVQRFKHPFRSLGVIEINGLAAPATQLMDDTENWVNFSVASISTAITDLSNARYYGPYRNAINQGAAQYFDLAVGTAVITQWDSWKAGGQLAYKRAIALVESDIARLIGATTVEINASQDNKTLDVRVDKHPFKLSDLGAGVSELVIAFANALISKPSYILIDEPESHLHPSLQNDFLTTLAKYARKGIAFTTHSIGLARSVSDQIYVVSKDKIGDGASCVTYEKHPRLGELLGSLSYSDYFPFGYAHVLLVEGTTEVRTLQVLLRKLGKDHDYVILPMGGSQLIRSNADMELSEVVRIAGAASRVFAIIDSEKANELEPLPTERVAFLASCAALGITAHVTARRATENYFSEKAIQAALGQSFGALENHQNLSSVRNGWAKSDNWRIAAEELPTFFQAHDLGQFLNELPAAVKAPE